MYQRFLIRETDRFVPFYFSQLEASLEKIADLLVHEPVGPKVEMLLSFVKTKTFPANLSERYPGLATLISSGSLETGFMEDLFASSRNNLLFRKELESYIESCLASAPDKARYPPA